MERPMQSLPHWQAKRKAVKPSATLYSSAEEREPVRSSAAWRAEEKERRSALLRELAQARRGRRRREKRMWNFPQKPGSRLERKQPPQLTNLSRKTKGRPLWTALFSFSTQRAVYFLSSNSSSTAFA